MSETKRKYKVILAVAIEGKNYRHGDVVELDAKTALDFSAALIPHDAEAHGKTEKEQ